jgi:hypothetical protein
VLGGLSGLHRPSQSRVSALMSASSGAGAGSGRQWAVPAAFGPTKTGPPGVGRTQVHAGAARQPGDPVRAGSPGDRCPRVDHVGGFSFGLAVAAVGQPRRLARQLLAVTDGFFAPLFFVWPGGVPRPAQARPAPLDDRARPGPRYRRGPDATPRVRPPAVGCYDAGLRARSAAESVDSCLTTEGGAEDPLPRPSVPHCRTGT